MHRYEEFQAGSVPSSRNSAGIGSVALLGSKCISRGVAGPAMAQAFDEISPSVPVVTLTRVALKSSVTEK